MSTVLVAGGSTGIGAAAVDAFRARGDRVLLADLNERDGKELVSRDRPGLGEFLPCDLSDEDGPAAAVAAAVELGDGSLDAVLYNAAVLEAAPLEGWTRRSWERSVAVNLTAPFFTCQAAAPHLRRSACGRIVLTASTGALRGHAGMPAYHATKAGILGLVRSLADELGPDGITVNAVCPGWVDTPFNDTFWAHQEDPAASLRRLTDTIPMRRQGQPGDLTGILLFLASEQAAYVTGQALVVDGGYTAV